MNNRYEELKTAINDYSWMRSECFRLESELHSLNTGNEGLSGLPGVGLASTNTKVMETRQATVRRLNKRYSRYKKTISAVESIADDIQTAREGVILDCRLDGMTITAISKHMNLSRRTIYRTIEDIIKEHLQKDHNG